MANLIIGHVTPQTARIWVRGDRKHPRAELRYRKKGVGSWTSRELGLEAHHGYVGVLDLEKLQPTTAYECSVSLRPSAASGKPLKVPVSAGTFRTAPAADNDVSFLVGSCNLARIPLFKDPDAAWEGIARLVAKERVDFMIHCGDQVYSDVPVGTPTPTLPYYRDLYQDSWKHKQTATVLASLPHYMVLDDHEIFDNFTNDSEFAGQPAKPIRDIALAAYREYQHSHNPITYPDGALHYSFDFGRCSFFVLDTRTERYARSDSQIIGTQQMTRLKDWLLAKQNRPKFVVTSVPFVAHIRGEGRDKWCGSPFREQREEVIDHVASHQIRKLVFLTGDMHCSCHTTMLVGPAAGAPLTIHELMSSPINQFGQSMAALLTSVTRTTHKGVPFEVKLDPDEFYGAHSNVMVVKVTGTANGERVGWTIVRTKKDEPPVRSGQFTL